MRSRKRRFGFTLVEVLVTTIVIGVLAAVVVPAMMRQTTAADPAQMASNLMNLRMGLESFMVDHKPYAPGDLEDLVNPITSADEFMVSSGVGSAFSTLGSGASTIVARWKGPYISRAAAVTSAATGAAWPLGSAGQIDFDLFVCSANVTSTGTGCAAAVTGIPNMLTIKLTGITAQEFLNMNQVIDGTEASSSEAGLLRYYTTSTTNFDVYFLATPYTSP